MRKGVHAPVATIVRSAVNLEPDLRFAPKTWGFDVESEEKMRVVASSSMKFTRPVASTCFRKHTIPASASAQPDRVLMYPQFPRPPPVFTAPLISCLLFNSTTLASSLVPLTISLTFLKLSLTYFSPFSPLLHTTASPDSLYRPSLPTSVVRHRSCAVAARRA